MPRAQPSGRAQPSPATSPASADQPRRDGAGQPRILVVEDDYFVALELEQVLREAGYAVVGIAVTAEEALTLARRHRPQLAVMDIRLAGRRDGIAAACALRAELGVPSVFASAHGDPETRRRAERARPLGWLLKPYAPEAALALVAAALARQG